MPRETANVPITGETLRWAREERGFTIAQAAQRFGLAEAELRVFEGPGDHEIPAYLFKNMRSVYKQLESVLLLPAPPQPDPLPRAFRPAMGHQPSLSPETLLVLREVRRFQHLITDLLAEERELLPHPNLREASLADDPEAIASASRQDFGVTIEMQREWPPQKTSFEQWRLKIQEQGILVFMEDMPWKDCRGIALPEKPLVPAIVVSKKDWPNSQIFTLFHEYAHLLLGQAGACIASPGTDGIRVERWCNRFSAAFLMPAAEIGTRAAQRVPKGAAWTSKEVNLIATRDFRVSRYAAARRLSELGITDYYKINSAALFAGERRARPKPEKETSGGVRAEVNRYSEIGAGVTAAIIGALNSRLIDTGTAAEMLRLRADKINAFTEWARSRQSGTTLDV